MSSLTKKVVVPLKKTNGIMRANITPKWFVTGAEYTPAACTFQLLINGEKAFGEVYDAIAAATQSICIICWGFQPSMYFKRGSNSLPLGASLDKTLSVKELLEKNLPIGELLEQKARAGIKVRVLSWSLAPLNENINATGFSGEANNPGRWRIRLKDRLVECTDEQHEENIRWYRTYDRQQVPFDTAVRNTKELFGNKAIANLEFYGRGFTNLERAKILASPKADKNIGAEMQALLAAAATHHQKMVLIYYESPQLATGFVMGHNMIDRYWDTNAHSSKGRSNKIKQVDGRTGANGFVPREDFSSRVTGPILELLYKNFAQAWKKETKESLPLPKTPFNAYAPRADKNNKALIAQIVRTQPQYGVTDIKKAYMQAIKNASQLIYMENQYFRWPPLADLIVKCAAGQTGWGRKPETHGNLYLFVITNSSDEGLGPGSVKTYEMLDKLGRADSIPHVAAGERTKRLKNRLTENSVKQRQITSARGGVATQPAMQAKLKALQAEQQQLQAQYNKQREQLQQLDKADEKHLLDSAKMGVISPEPRPGLRVHVATISAPDTVEGQAWMETYIHAKLTIIDDTFMTLGSTNINTRSMETDSELNLLHDRPEISQPARKKLWDLHTKGYTDGRVADMPLDEAFKAWDAIMNENKNRKYRANPLPPIAPLTPFFRGSAERKNQD